MHNSNFQGKIQINNFKIMREGWDLEEAEVNKDLMKEWGGSLIKIILDRLKLLKSNLNNVICLKNLKEPNKLLMQQQIFKFLKKINSLTLLVTFKIPKINSVKSFKATRDLSTIRINKRILIFKTMKLLKTNL